MIGATHERYSFDWHILRKVICERYYRGRTVEHCPGCKDKAPCFQMIEDALDLIAGFKKTKRDEAAADVELVKP